MSKRNFFLSYKFLVIIVIVILVIPSSTVVYLKVYKPNHAENSTKKPLSLDIVEHPNNEAPVNPSSVQSAANTTNTDPTNPSTSATLGASTTVTPKPKPVANNPETSPTDPTQPNDDPSILAACLDQKATYQNQYNANVNAENALYQSNKDILSVKLADDELDNDGYQQALATEDQRHLGAISALITQYQQQLDSLAC